MEFDTMDALAQLPAQESNITAECTWTCAWTGVSDA